ADADAQQRLYHARREIPAPDKEGGKDAAGRNQKIAPGAVTSNLRLPPKRNSMLAIRLLLAIFPSPLLSDRERLRTKNGYIYASSKRLTEGDGDPLQWRHRRRPRYPTSHAGQLARLRPGQHPQPQVRQIVGRAVQLHGKSGSGADDHA